MCQISGKGKGTEDNEPKRIHTALLSYNNNTLNSVPNSEIAITLRLPN
jgi:hypothetical protein